MDNRDWAINELIKKNESLGRMPLKDDFAPDERVKIKNALGPWPRALETAGLKPVTKKNIKK